MAKAKKFYETEGRTRLSIALDDPKTLKFIRKLCIDLECSEGEIGTLAVQVLKTHYQKISPGALEEKGINAFFESANMIDQG